MTGQAGIEPGFVLASRYVIGEKLGAGGMGVVYQAHDRLLNETVAIKVLRPEAAQTPETAARFISEIKLARAVSHRSVARIHEYGEAQGIRYISMAFVDGVDLKRVVRERGPLPPARALEIAIHVAEGLHAIHEEGIVHRDLKSSNIMMDGHGAVRLMDFGLAKLWSVDKPQDMTASGQIVGTPEYMSPEQILGRDLDRRSDIYSLAVVLYELLAGHTPFRGDTPIATLMMQLNDPPPLEGPAFARVPASLVALLRRALGKRPEERFASALELARALEQARAGWIAAPDDFVPTVTLTPTAIPPITVAADRAPTVAPRQHRVGLGLVSAMAGVVIGGLLVFTLVHRGAFRATADTAQAVTKAPSPDSSGAVTSPVPAPPATTSTAAPQQRRDALPRPAGPSVRAVPGATADAAPLAGGAREPKPDESSRVSGQVDTLLTEAGVALEAQRYDAAIALYDRILGMDPRQQVARVARATAVNAKAAARPAAPAPSNAGRAFVAGKTSASLGDDGPERAYAQAFEEGQGLDVQKDTPVARPPGRIEFEARPEQLVAGEKYTLRVYFANPARAPIEIRDMIVTNTVDGRKSSGPVAPSTRTVAPEQKALLLSLSDFLADGTESWSLEVRVQTAGGETYRNQVTWK